MFRLKQCKKLPVYFMTVILIGLAISLVSAAVVASGDAATKIILRAEAEITSQRIYLGDIAQIQTADERLRQKLKGVDIGRANPVGRSRTITIPHIQVRISGHQLDASQYTFIGSKCAVRRKELTVPSARILEAVEAFYRERLILGGTDAEFQLESKMPIRPIRIPDENATLKFVPLNSDLWKGRLEVQVIHNGGITDRAALAFQLSVNRPVVVAVQNLPRRIVIKPEHLKLERQTTDISSGLPLTELAEAIGKTTDVAISQGEIMTASHLQKTYLVSRGSIVTLTAQRGSLKIEAKGKALENAELGQLVRVMNLTSRKEVIGEVIGEKQVRIHF